MAGLAKPTGLYDRTAEWQDLARFVGHSDPGASLALVYGRRRQGKTLMLELLAEASAGFMFTGLQQSDTQNLDAVSRAYVHYAGLRVPVRFRDWAEAVDALLALGENSDEPVPVILDEFPYLTAGGQTLPSVIQNALSPRGRARRRSRVRLILCGSAMTTMRTLLHGSAPLRGRAVTELLVQPFDFRAAAEFWGVDDRPSIAVRTHALVGGTPGYRDMCGSAPTDDFDTWVVETLLNPSSAMFREGHVLLSEEPAVSDLVPYYSVLGAISQGNTRRGEIAQAVGREDSALTHPLTVLEQAGLVNRVDDALRRRRTTYHIAEPVLRLHQLIIRPQEERLLRRAGAQVWAEIADTVTAKIYGPHFEELSRQWCAAYASSETLGGVASRVRPAVLACPQHQAAHEVDVVVTTTRPQAAEEAIAIGEAKWRAEPVGIAQLERLDHLRDLVPQGVDSRPPRLLLFGAAFTAGLIDRARARRDVELVDLERLYSGD